MIFIVPMIGPSDEKHDKVMTRTTNDPNWYEVASLVQRQMWLLLATCDDRSDDQNMTMTSLMTTVTTFDDQCDDLLMTLEISWQHLTDPSGDVYRLSRKLPLLLLFYSISPEVGCGMCFWGVLAHVPLASSILSVLKMCVLRVCEAPRNTTELSNQKGSWGPTHTCVLLWRWRI